MNDDEVEYEWCDVPRHVERLAAIVAVKFATPEELDKKHRIQIVVNNMYEILNESAVATTFILPAPALMLPGFYITVKKPTFGKLTWLEMRPREAKKKK